MDFGFVAGDDDATPLHVVVEGEFDRWRDQQADHVSAWLAANGVEGKAEEICTFPQPDGGLAGAVVCVSEGADCYALAGCPARLPAGAYRLVGTLDDVDAVCLGWGLAQYRYGRYKSTEPPSVRLRWPREADRSRIEAMLAAQYLVRDLVNTPAEDMGPAALAGVAKQVAEQFGASYSEVVGEALLEERLPAIHAVGRAAQEAPRLVDIRWGDVGPRITLVGKGVCFDSGGLDIKSASGMRLMKKDMGGAAHALALARLLMTVGVEARLRLLLPIVENAVSGSAYRPGDVVETRSGRTVEIGNTDAEGRVILCDALTLGAEDDPALMIDFATLTGAARVALGPDLPALFANDESLAKGILHHGREWSDPVWRLPLHEGYRSLLDSPIADMNNISSGGMGGAITAALYLQAFVPDQLPWAHLDTYAWNKSSRPGRPEGGEALGLRAVFGAIESYLET